MADAFDDSPVVIAELPHIKLFGKWSSEDVNHSDMSLAVSVYIYVYRFFRSESVGSIHVFLLEMHACDKLLQNGLHVRLLVEAKCTKRD